MDDRQNPPSGEELARRAARRRGSLVIWAWLVAAALTVGLVVRWALAPRPPTPPALGPLRTSLDPRTGEHTAPFSGFAVAVETEPQGALVVVGGIERGEAPVLAGVDCEPGEEVEVSAAAPGGGEARAVTVCRRDTLVKLTLRLGR